MDLMETHSTAALGGVLAVAATMSPASEGNWHLDYLSMFPWRTCSTRTLGRPAPLGMKTVTPLCDPSFWAAGEVSDMLCGGGESERERETKEEEGEIEKKSLLL